jgi:hypothetical protein
MVLYSVVVLMTTNTISTFMNDVVFEEKEHNYAVESII